MIRRKKIENKLNYYLLDLIEEVENNQDPKNKRSKVEECINNKVFVSSIQMIQHLIQKEK